MKKIVKNGDRTTTVTLDGGECEVIFSQRYNVFSVASDEDVVVALESGKSEGDDGTLICKGGESVMYPHMAQLDRVYLTGSGKVQVVASNVAVNSFKKRAKGGDVIKPAADYVQDGLIAEWVLDGNPNEPLTNPQFVNDGVWGRMVGKVVNGESSFFVKKDSFEYVENDGVTLQCLVNVDPSIAQLSDFLTVGENHGDYGSNVALGIGMNSSGKLLVTMPSDDRSVDYTLMPNTWYQLAVVYINYLHYIVLYVNGKVVATITKELKIPRLMSGAAIGTWVWSRIYPQASASNRGNFLIANCCVYDRQLSNKEIAANYEVDKKRYGIGG